MLITVNWIFGVLSTAAIGFIGWTLKELYSQVKQDRIETRKLIEQQGQVYKELLDKLENKVYKIDEKLPEKYVLKEDFYREINKLDAKLDNVREDIADLHKTVSSLVALIKNEVKE